ncbi:MAG: signal peptidase I [Actinomycetota bacterium]
MLGHWKRTSALIVTAIAAASACSGSSPTSMTMSSAGMEPTIAKNAEIHVDKDAFKGGVPNRNDVTVWLDEQVNEIGVKRVVALPSESVEYSNCELTIDGAAVEEPFLPADANTSCGGDGAYVEVPEGFVYLMGDNRGGSKDSRDVGPVAIASLRGRVTEWKNAAQDWVALAS